MNYTYYTQTQNTQHAQHSIKIGFVHTAFTFINESMISRSGLGRSNVPPGALISFLQKGLQYVGIEETIRQDHAAETMERAGVGGSGNTLGTTEHNSRKRDRQRERDKSKKNSNSSSSSGNSHNKHYNDNEEMDLSLLCPLVMKALMRREPPIKLNVPPEAAAAALRVRIEAENKAKQEQLEQKKQQEQQMKLEQQQQQQQQQQVNHRINTSTSSNGPLATPQAMQIQQQHHQQQHQQQHHPQQTVAQPHLHSNPQTHVNTHAHPNSTSTINMPSATTRSSSSSSQSQPQWTQQNRQEAAKAMMNMNANVNMNMSRNMNNPNQNPPPHLNHVNPNNSKQQQQQAPPPQPNPNLRPPNGYDTAISDKAAAARALATLIAPQGAGEFANTASTTRTSTNESINHKTNSNNTNITGEGDRNEAAKVLAGGMQMPLTALHHNQTPSTNNPTPNNPNNHPNQTPLHPNNPNPANPTQNPPISKTDLDKDDLLTRARPFEVLELNKHTSEVFMCAWNPIFTDLLATGSGDASARIWKMGGQSASYGSGTCRLLQHGNSSSDKKNKDVTTLEWSSDGERLATGSYDGVARVWTKDGLIVHTLCGHVGPIFSLKWNKKGNYLLSGSYDKTTIVWNVSSAQGEVKQQFHNHTAPALDVDWKDADTFASCSTDKSVLICKVGLTAPLIKFTGHKDEVNAVKWDPSGRLLASCSDDYTAKVWDMASNSNQPLHDFKSHKQEIYTVKW